MKHILFAQNMRDAQEYIKAGRVPRNLIVLTPTKRAGELMGVQLGSIYATPAAYEEGIDLNLLREVRQRQAMTGTAHLRDVVVLEES